MNVMSVSQVMRMIGGPIRDRSEEFAWASTCEPEYLCAYCAEEISPEKICRRCASALGLETDDQIRQYVASVGNSAERAEKLLGRSSHRGVRDPNDVRLETQNHSLGEGHTNFFGWEAITIQKRDYEE